MAAITRQYLESLVGSPNVQKYLSLISQAEGTTKNGYATAFGGSRLNSLADHPRTLHGFTQTDGKSNQTSAAGRYQFLRRTWDDVKQKYGLQDFGPRSQDIGALALIAQAGALNHVLNGDFTAAINKTGSIWASLPSSPYAQPKRSWGFINKMTGQQGADRSIAGLISAQDMQKLIGQPSPASSGNTLSRIAPHEMQRLISQQDIPASGYKPEIISADQMVQILGQG